MTKVVGIRNEDKSPLERRIPLVPSDIEQLAIAHGLQFQIESPSNRVFRDEEFTAVGAKITDNLDACDLILGVKEIPISKLEQGKTYMFFSHVIKGQSYNMPMLQKMMELGCNLIDYEKIADDNGRRQIFFGRFAGLAGMINTLWTLGRRYKALGVETPFALMKQSHKYNSLEEAISDTKLVAEQIRTHGLPDEILPFVTAFTGYGNVAKGAWEIFDLLPHKVITPKELDSLKPEKHLIYKVVFKEQDLSKRKSGDFNLQEYYENPEDYEDRFNEYLHHFNCVVNGMYWDPRYPRIITKDKLAELNLANKLRLAVIGDITCDPDGSIECTHKATEINDPVFVYDPKTRSPKMGFEGDGVAVMAVDILPSELPRESSKAFSEALRAFIPNIANADFTQSYADIVLVPEIKRALILLNGKFTPDYEYLQEFVTARD